MQQSEFEQLASCGFNRIPLVRQLVADKDTPVSSYLKLAKAPYTFLLESVEGGDKWGRYSIIGMPCKTVLKAYGNHVSISENGHIVESFECDDPLEYVETFRARYQSPEIANLPMFNGGLVGYFAYDSVRYVEKKLKNSCPPNDIGNPDILLMVTDEVLIFDNLSGTASLVVYVNPADDQALETGKARLKALSESLKGPSPQLPDIAPFPPAKSHIQESDFVSSFGEKEFQAAVSKVREYVLAGDVMQVVPSQRLSVGFEHDPFNLYRALRRMNPSPYMYYLDLEDFHVVGSSPEILARVEDGDVTVRPIAGTRKRGRDEAHDKALEEELLADPKERAEHLMLIDLGRNDVGRVAKTGTVELTDKMVVERYSHVMHIVSNVKGKLRDGLNAIDVLKAALPAGTLSGAPKIRAMEIIDELESVKRGIYGGAVGYIAWNGNMDTAIAIRTGVIKDQTLYVQAGAGIVADSDPVMEWEETMNKARAIFTAAAMVSAQEGEE